MPLFGRGRKAAPLSSPLKTSSGARRSRSLTASGERVRRQDMANQRRLLQQWQSRALDYYDTIGEIKYASQFYSRMLAPLRLYAAEKDSDGDWIETENPEAIAALERIQDPGGGRQGLQWDYGRLMFLIGETELFVSLDDYGDEQWEFLSPDELRIQDGIYMRYRAPALGAEEYTPSGDGDEAEEGTWVPVQENTARPAVAYRIWQRHPRYSGLADSTMHGVLDTCEELTLLTKAVRARTRSRLAGNGLLLIDERISPTPPEAGPDEDPSEDPWLNDLIDAMMSPLEDEGSAAAMVPLLARVTAPEGGTVGDLIAHLQLVDPTQLYPETGLRYECIKRLAVGLDMPPEELTGMATANHWCMSDDTEILTADGWQLHGTLEEGDTVLTLNHETGLSEWQPVETVARFEVDDLPMLAIESRFHSSLSTMNHRWPVLRRVGRDQRWEREWTHSDELGLTHRMITAAPSRDSLMPQWVQHDDALVELVAWLWTEGQIRCREGRHSPSVAIYQSHEANPENVLRIRAALASLFGVGAKVAMHSDRRSAEWSPPAWREVQQGGKTVFSINRTAARDLLAHIDTDRVVSTDFIRTLTASQLALFVDTSVRGDGSLTKSGTRVLCQSAKERLFPFELAVILLGETPSSTSTVTQGFTEHVQHWVSASRRQTHRLKKHHMTEQRYTGTIWCPVTGNSTWLARRNGKVFYTGNTAWIVDENTWKAHGQPKADQLVNDLTSAYFRPYLRDSVGMGEQARKFAIKYDAAAVINHPDRSKDAKDLHSAIALSDAALRDACGFSEDDAPTTEERARMIGIATRDSSLAWFGVPTVRGGQIETAPGEVVNATTPGAPGGPSTGAEVEPGPPDPAPNEQPAVVASIVARIQGAADLAQLRAREAAGNRLISLAKRDKDLHAMLRGVKTSEVAATLGRERVRALKAPSEQELAGGARDLIADALRMYGLDQPDLVDVIVDTIERHAARTLYDRRPAPLPDTFALYLTGLVVKAQLPLNGSTPATRRPAGAGR